MFVKGDYSWKVFIGLSIIGPLIVFLYIKRWSRNQWQEHPIAQTLALYSTPQQSWIAVATDINVEFRRCVFHKLGRVVSILTEALEDGVALSLPSPCLGCPKFKNSS
jgi:hypothetical protein